VYRNAVQPGSRGPPAAQLLGIRMMESLTRRGFALSLNRIRVFKGAAPKLFPPARNRGSHSERVAKCSPRFTPFFAGFRKPLRENPRRHGILPRRAWSCSFAFVIATESAQFGQPESSWLFSPVAMGLCLTSSECGRRRSHPHRAPNRTAEASRIGLVTRVFLTRSFAMRWQIAEELPRLTQAFFS